MEEEKLRNETKITISKFIVMLIVIVAVITWFLILGNSTDDNTKNTTSTDEAMHTQVLTKPQETMILNIFGMNNKNFLNLYQEFADVEFDTAGDFNDPGIMPTHFYTSAFNFDERDITAVDSVTGIEFNPGNYKFFAGQLSSAPNTPNASFEFGYGSNLGDGSIISDANSIEPIANSENSLALFCSANPKGWQGINITDVTNGYQPTGDKAACFLSPDNEFFALIVPLSMIGAPGTSADVALQFFSRRTPENQAPSLGDEIAVVFRVFDGLIPDPAQSPIFADGFESGDVSAWSNAVN